MSELDLEALRRRLAAIEHERWAHWQGWMHGACRRLPSGELVIPAPLVERWERQIKTPYDQLSEAEQRADMEQVDRYWPLIAVVLERAERVEAAAREVYGPCPEWPDCADGTADDEGPCYACAQWARFLDRAVLAPAPAKEAQRQAARDAGLARARRAAHERYADARAEEGDRG